MPRALHLAARPVRSAALILIMVVAAAACGGGSPSPAPSAASTARGSSPVSGAPGNGGLGTKIVPAPPGFALSRRVSKPKGPLSAADFNQGGAGADLAAYYHFVRGYFAHYDSNTNSDTIMVSLVQFATPAAAATWEGSIVASGLYLSYRDDPAIPGGVVYDLTAPYGLVRNGVIYNHDVIATKGNLAFLILEATRSAPVSLVEKMARQQYAAL